MGEPQGPHRLSKLALSPGPLRIVLGRRPEPMSKAWAPEWANLIVIGTTDCTTWRHAHLLAR
jgi:hypothetical protein